MLPIAKEVRSILWFFLAITILVHIYFGFLSALPLWFILFPLIIGFRELSRTIPSSPLASLSPVDGRITDVGLTHDPYLNRDALRIRIRQNLYGEYIIYSPIEAKIKKRLFHTSRKGTTPFSIPVSQLVLWLKTDEKDDVVVAVRLEYLPRVILCQVQAGERLGYGQRCGLIGFGCPVEIYLPATANSDVKPGQQVKAGSDIIAKLRYM
jgi:phosphatidylserine decarboxylase